MIKEKTRGNTTYLVIVPDKKENRKILIDLVDKIQKKQKEPFAQIFINVYPPYLFPLMLLLNKKEIKIKKLQTTKTEAILEI